MTQEKAIYSVITDIFDLNNGINDSVFRRQKFLDRNGIDGKIIVLDANLSAYRHAKAVGLKKTDYISMYDYLQEIPDDLDPRLLDARFIESIPRDRYFVEIDNPNEYNLFEAGKKKLSIEIAPSSLHIVKTVHFYDDRENLFKSDRYDWRGFLSSTVYYDEDSNYNHIQFYDLDGNTKIVIQYSTVDGQYAVGNVDLLNHRGKNYSFANEEQLTKFFFEELLAEKPGSLIVDDASTLHRCAVFEMPEGTTRAFFLHESHLTDNHDDLHAEINANAANFVQYFSPYYNTVLLGNEAQAKNFGQLMPNNSHDHVRYLNDLLFEPLEVEHKYKDKPIDLSYFGTFNDNKRIPLMLNIFKMVLDRAHEEGLDQANDINLHLAGFGEQVTLDLINQTIDQLGIRDRVTVEGYRQRDRLEHYYRNTDIALDTSKTQGSALGIAESMHHGIPVVAFNNDFGQRTLIQKNVNGKLIDNNELNEPDINAYVNAIINYLKHPDTIEKHGRAARKFIEDNYNDEKAVQNLNAAQLFSKAVTD